MKIEVNLNKKYLIFFGIIVAFALMGGVIAAVSHHVNEINWNEQIQGTVNAQNLVAQNAVFANGYCFGATDCVASWAAMGARIGAVTSSYWTVSGGTLVHSGSITVAALCISGVCINHIDASTKMCNSGSYVTKINFRDQTIECAAGGTNPPVCTNQCPTFGQYCSDSTHIAQCYDNNGDGCFESIPFGTCSAGQTCSNGQCMPTGVCTPGQTQCVGTTGQQTCGSNSQWGGTISCSAGWACDPAYGSCRSKVWTDIGFSGYATGINCGSFGSFIVFYDAFSTAPGDDGVAYGTWYVSPTGASDTQPSRVGLCGAGNSCTGDYKYCLSFAPTYDMYCTSCRGFSCAQLSTSSATVRECK